MPKNAEIYICECCDFKCSKLSNYNIHIIQLENINGQSDTTTLYNEKYNPTIVMDVIKMW